MRRHFPPVIVVSSAAPELTRNVSATPPVFDLLPLSSRVVDRLSTMLVLTHEILDDLATAEATGIAWAGREVQAVYAELDALMERLAQ